MKWTERQKNHVFVQLMKKKNVILFKCGTVYEEPDKIYFALVWKDQVIKIRLCQNVMDKDTTIWELLAINIPEDLEVYKDEIIADLRNAMKVYGFDGDISYLCDGDETYLDKVGKTIINF